MGFYEKFKIVTSDIFKFFLPLVLTFLKDNGPTILEIALKVIPIIAMSLAVDGTTGVNSGAEKRKASYVRSKSKGA